MNFIESIKNRAKKEIKTIVLPEAEDIRTLKATQIALKEEYANIVLVGNEEIIKQKAQENNVNIEGATIIKPHYYEEYKNKSTIEEIQIIQKEI